MAVKKASVESTMAKVEAAKVETKTETKTETKVEKAPAKKAATKTAAAKTETKAAAKTETKAAAKTETKAVAKTETKAAAKKAPAKKAAATKTTTQFFVEYAGGQVSSDDIVAKAVEASGKKSLKTLNVYYQPETGMVYFTADGEEGSFAL